MGGTFACPECGNELALKGTSPGRQVRCGWCETWVEVPFLPRAASPPLLRRSTGRRRPPWVVWAWAGLGVGAALVLMLGATRAMRSRAQGQLEQSVAALVAAAEDSEKAGQADKALETIDRAINEAGRLDPPQPDRVAALQQERDRLARAAVEARLAAAANADPAAAIAVYKDVLSRVWREAGLDGLEPSVRAKLEETRKRWAESDVLAARRAIDDGRPDDAIDFCERLVKTIDELPVDIRDKIRRDADSLVSGIIAARGVKFEPANGQFTIGTPASYAELIDSSLGGVLRDRGYLPRRAGSAWTSVWDGRAPFRVAVEVGERQEESYMQSHNRLSFLTCTITLYRRDSSAWRVGPISARTQPSIPSLSAFTASRVLTDDHPSAEFEKLLYDDARTALKGKIIPRLRTIPKCRPVVGGPG